MLSFSILFLAITVGCLWEFYSMAGLYNKPVLLFDKIWGLLSGTLVFVLSVMVAAEVFAYSALFWLLLPISLFFIFQVHRKTDSPFINIALFLSGLFYIALPFSLLPFLGLQSGVYRSDLIIGVLFLVWINDTGAYIVGLAVGKTPLFPRVSPRKTWEGLIGGVFFALVFSYFIPQLLDTDMNKTQWITISIIVCLLGTYGGFVNSMLKRSIHIKDSGKLLPGHGGLLDRFDSLLLIIPILALYVFVLK
jgi:phosphatidate cytidylyltransferase